MKIDWNKIVVAVLIATILGIGGTIIHQGQQIARLEIKIDGSEKQIDELKSEVKGIHNTISSSNLSGSGQLSVSVKVQPEKLIEIIKQQQALYVKESWGSEAYQCFTDNDLKKFKESKVTQKITQELRTDNKFIDVVLAIKTIPKGNWQDLKESSLITFKPTWSKIGKISREGQTETGQQAEKMIAKAIVDLVVELVNQSEENIKKLYSY